MVVDWEGFHPALGMQEESLGFAFQRMDGDATGLKRVWHLGGGVIHAPFPPWPSSRRRISQLYMFLVLVIVWYWGGCVVSRHSFICVCLEVLVWDGE